jgi:hypothetical protein
MAKDVRKWTDAELLGECMEALERIAHAKPDRLDHSLDVLIIERAARLAQNTLVSVARKIGDRY